MLIIVLHLFLGSCLYGQCCCLNNNITLECNILSSSSQLILSRKHLTTFLFQSISWYYDITSAWIQWLIVIFLIIIHTSITFGVYLPDCGKGYVGPGGLEEHGKFFNCTGGVAGFIDRSIFGNHMYKHPSCQRVYENQVFFDPEGQIVLYYLFLKEILKCLVIKEFFKSQWNKFSISITRHIYRKS